MTRALERAVTTRTPKVRRPQPEPPDLGDAGWAAHWASMGRIAEALPALAAPERATGWGTLGEVLWERGAERADPEALRVMAETMAYRREHLPRLPRATRPDGVTMILCPPMRADGYKAPTMAVHDAPEAWSPGDLVADPLTVCQRDLALVRRVRAAWGPMPPVPGADPDPVTLRRSMGFFRREWRRINRDLARDGRSRRWRKRLKAHLARMARAGLWAPGPLI